MAILAQAPVATQQPGTHLLFRAVLRTGSTGNEGLRGVSCRVLIITATVHPALATRGARDFFPEVSTFRYKDAECFPAHSFFQGSAHSYAGESPSVHR